jgi:alpha-tubulin suppressor-like RCC1 family protein
VTAVLRRALGCALAAFAGHASAQAPLLAASTESSYAIDSQGRPYGWGSDEQGKLGLGKLVQSATRQRVGAGFTDVAAGYHASFARSSDGTWWAWGSNNGGQLGDGAGG